MFRLFMVIYTLAGATLAGSAVVGALTMNLVDSRSIIYAALAGAVVAVPVAWAVANRLSAA